MLFFVFKVLPIVTLLVFIMGVVMISKGIANSNQKHRLIGMALIAFFALLLTYLILMAFASL